MAFGKGRERKKDYVFASYIILIDTAALTVKHALVKNHKRKKALKVGTENNNKKKNESRFPQR